MKIDLKELKKAVEYFEINTREIKLDLFVDHGFVTIKGFDDNGQMITIKLFNDNTIAEITKTEKFR